jgi:hypothetical protein
MTKKMTEGRDPETGQFVQSYKGGGRLKGSRNKLGEAFIADVYAKWQARGGEALERMIDTDPGGFVRVVAQVLPDKLEVDVKHTISRIERVIVDPKVIEHRPLELGHVGPNVGSDGAEPNSPAISSHDGGNDLRQDHERD